MIGTPNTSHHMTSLLQVITRFPPEPNGFLHIGHAMAMHFSFNYAKVHGGMTYLRFDDTNPETAQEVYVKDVLEMVEWLGKHSWKEDSSFEISKPIVVLTSKQRNKRNNAVFIVTLEKVRFPTGFVVLLD